MVIYSSKFIINSSYNKLFYNYILKYLDGPFTCLKVIIK